MGFRSRRSTKVPLLNARHRAARLFWSREHRDWKRVAWSDESRFRLPKIDRRLRILLQVHEAMDPACQLGTVQGHGGSIMVRGVFCASVWDFWCVYQPPSIIRISTEINSSTVISNIRTSCQTLNCNDNNPNWVYIRKYYKNSMSAFKITAAIDIHFKANNVFRNSCSYQIINHSSSKPLTL
ncbi:uncharacterized protein TNCV_3150201 [Trichonephila clavipes]|nr:uncharacterized protein TNCV_3150201 [Trichonephila clavipes]